MMVDKPTSNAINGVVRFVHLGRGETVRLYRANESGFILFDSGGQSKLGGPVRFDSEAEALAAFDALMDWYAVRIALHALGIPDD